MDSFDVHEAPGNGEAVGVIVGVVYTSVMRRIQLYLDDDMDDALTAQAAKLGTTRSALVRDAVRASVGADLHAADPFDDLIGWLDVEPDDDFDAVIYGLNE